jgi:hypothetical protein
MSDGFFSRAAGQQRRAALDNALSGFANRYLGPTGIPERLNALAELFPVAEMERGSLAAQRVAGADNWQDRVSGTGDVLSAVAAVVAPGLALNRVGSGPAVALSESLAGVSSSPTAQGAREMGAQFVADEFGGMGRGAADEVSQRGAQIMDMLRSGRGADVTDAMLDLGDPALNTRLNQWLFENYDLPMDQASRMERAAGMGFDTGDLLYHGTDSSQITSFDPSRGAERLPATFLTDSRRVASTYGDNVGEYFARAENPAEFHFDGRSVTSFNNETVTPGQLVRRVKSAADDARVYGSEVDTDLAFDLASAGVEPMYADVIDAVRMRNVVDDFDWGGSAANNLAVFDPANIRSRFARFDPRLAHLRNLSAGVAGVGLLNALAPADYTADPQEIRNYLAGL